MQAAESAGRTPMLATWCGGPPLSNRTELLELADPPSAVAAVAAIMRRPPCRVGA
jgi:hypothetical protein